MTSQANHREQAKCEQLRALIGRLVPANRFYTPILERAGIAADLESLDAFYQRMPFTTKSQLVDDQQTHPPYGTNLTEPLGQYVRFHRTSGTTSKPLHWLDTAESWSAMIDVWAEVFRGGGVGAGDRVLFTFSFGPFIGFWLAFESAERLGCLCLPAGGLSSVARLGMLIENEVTALCCTPTYAVRLGQVAADEGIDLSESKLRTIIVGGEPGGSVPATRQRIEAAFPIAKVVDHHGMTEVGPCTYSDPKRTHVLRIVDEAFLAEVIDPATGAHVEAGGTGELVLTTLHRAACPLIRYRTGDVVKRYEYDDGSFGLEGGIIGRADDMVSIRGVNVYPSAVDQIVRSCGGVDEYQVCLRETPGGLMEMTLRIEPIGDADPQQLVRALAGAFKVSMALRVPIEIADAGSLPRFEMKAKRWVRES